MAVQIRKATREELLGRLAFIGISGSGKTITAIVIGMILAALKGKRLGVIDTENRSASKYVGMKHPAAPGGVIDFDVIELESFHPDRYIEAIEAFEANPETGAIVVDSLSHAWIGKDGVLEIKENAAKKKGNNDFTAWREASPHHSRLVEKLIRSSAHLIVCMRAKAEFAVQSNEVTKKTEVVKLGMAAEQRGGLEYEFDVVFDLDLKHFATPSKTRCSDFDGKAIDVTRDTKKIAEIFAAWLSIGSPRTVPPQFDSAPVLARLSAAPTLDALNAIGAEVASLAGAGRLTETDKARLRAAYDERAMALAQASAPARTFEDDSTITDPAQAEAIRAEAARVRAEQAAAIADPKAPLSPGVDVPAMDTKKPDPAPEAATAVDPGAEARAAIFDAFEKSKTETDLNRLVAPLIDKHKAKLSKKDLDDARGLWNTLSAAMKKAGGSLP